MGYRASALRGDGRDRAAISMLALGLKALVGAGLLAAGAALAQATAAPTVIEVQAGDCFSAIASRYTGQPWRWRQLYHPQRSGLPDPGRLQVGMQLELVTEPTGRRYLRRVGARPAPVLAALPPPAAGSDEPLVVGVLPNIGAAVLQAQYENLRSWFERRQSQKLRIVIPANFQAFFDSMVRGEFDLAVAAPHFARVAQTDRGLVPLLMYEPRINALFVAALDDKVRAAGDLRGKTVGFANPTSLVALYGLQWLRQQGLEAGKDFEVRGARTDMGVGRLLLTGEVAGAVMSQSEMRTLPQDESSRMKTVESFARIPNFIIVAHPRLGAARIARLKSQLKAFAADRDEGAAFVRATGITGMAEPDEAVLRELDPYLAPTRRAMGYTP